MSPLHHPGDELLVAHAAGSCGEAVSLLIATHVSFCAACRCKVAEAESVGGALLCDIAPAALARSADDLIARLRDETAAPPPESPQVRQDSSTPVPLRSYVGELESLRWRTMAPGVSRHPVLARGGVRATLLRTAPGAVIAAHTHRGQELTLVLSGGYRDETGEYRAGDVQTATPELTHSPATDARSWCVSLVVTDAPLSFVSPATGFLAAFFGF